MNTIDCPVCGKALSFSIAKGRKSNKPFIMLKCDTDGRHIRAFITDRTYVQTVLTRLEASRKDRPGDEA